MALAAGCEVDPNQRLVTYGEFRLEPTKFEDLPGWQDDLLLEAVPALRASCDAFLAGDPGRSLGLAGRGGTYGDWVPACQALTSAQFASDGDVRALLEQQFRLFRVTQTSAREGFVTGYAEATVRVSLRRTDYYQYPIYAPPPDLLEVDPEAMGEDWPGQVARGHVVDFQMQPYFDREEIEDGALEGRGLEIAWADDPIDLFTLHQQGEGVVVFDTGERRRIEAVADNGHPRGSILRTLIAREILPREDASWGAAREWLRAHPDEAENLMELDTRYAFFAWSQDQAAAPVGAFGVPLTAGRSLAVDINLLPLGVPVWIDVAGLTPGSERIRRLTVAHDVEAGVAGFISGALFLGAGADAVATADMMNSSGRMYVLLPHQVAGFQ
jgi:membrane-bound lytic murein transglycosylase A